MSYVSPMHVPSVISLLLLSQSPELYQGVIDDCGSILISVAELAPKRTMLFPAELSQPWNGGSLETWLVAETSLNRNST